MRTFRFEVLTTADESRWREALDDIGVYDFYHLPSFHRLAEIRGEGEAVMPVFRERGCTLAFPLLFRNVRLPGSTGVNGLRDATSVYGFAGPLSPEAEVPEDVRQHFLLTLQEFFEQNRILTVFSRLNPLFDQSRLLSGYGEVVERGVTLAIDLTVPPEVQVSRYQPSVRRNLRKLRRLGFECEEAGTECLDDFIRIYLARMEKVGAQDIYLFDKPYFEYLMNEMSDVMHLFVCRYEGRVVCGGIVAACNDTVEAHLSATDAEYRAFSPAKLLYDVRREWANTIGARIMHLGGGVEGRRDSLWEFKRAFGAFEHVHATWRAVVDEATYGDLCREMRLVNGSGSKDTYFPAYRDPALQTQGMLTG